jgi:hypothetical protein
MGELAMFEIRNVLLCVTSVAIVLAIFGWQLKARAAYESADYTVLSSEGPFDTRKYPDLMIASTNMQLKAKGDDDSFMRLFRYISGANDKEQKLAMTTPVFMEPEPGDGGAGQMGFVIPTDVAEERIPKPADAKVQIGKRAGGRFAVIRFSGRMSAKSVADAEKRLRKWMKDKDLVGDGDAETAGYDPPWTPGPMRRNEVLIRLK